ncbi:carboxymuconolactone decarboxylase family protein [Kocuria turfanensis]|uniref:carboxymuconolactone decarboxylase family protein n=1 Tax=Kocuria turfanensis TaxID=388357 RepID=UPI004035A938
MTARDRFFLDKSDPDSWHALNGLAGTVAGAAEEAGISRAVLELVNVRISQLNGCAYCLDLHVRYAVKAGVSSQQLAVLTAWREAEALYSELERAALAVGEAATVLPEESARTAELAAARETLTDEQFSALQWAAVTMNAFNRISILSRHPVRSRGAAKAAAGTAPAPATPAPARVPGSGA